MKKGLDGNDLLSVFDIPTSKEARLIRPVVSTVPVPSSTTLPSSPPLPGTASYGNQKTPFGRKKRTPYSPYKEKAEMVQKKRNTRKKRHLQKKKKKHV